MTLPLMLTYYEKVTSHLKIICSQEEESIKKAARMMADQISRDKIIYAFGPGGHSNLGTQEIFFRAGGLMHVSAILDEGTLLSNGALRSMAIERLPGYGKIVIKNAGIKEGELLLIINAYGINSAVIDAALEARELGVLTIGVTSVSHAEQTSKDHPARHPTKKNLHELVDIVLDSKVPVGDAVLDIEGVDEKVAAISTFANAFLLNVLAAHTIELLAQEGKAPPIWRSGNAPGGDEANAQFIEQFKHRIKAL